MGGRFGFVSAVFAVVACGGAPHEPSTPEATAAAKVSQTGPAPVDREVSSVPGVSAEYVAAPVFGGRLYVLRVTPPGERVSDEPPLVLVHGLANAGARDFYPILAGLAQGRRVIAFDLPGFGRSSGGAPPYVPLRYVEVLAQVIRAYAGGRADVLGHSMGGAIALEHSARHPEQVRRLVLVDVAGVMHKDAFLGYRLDSSMGASLAPLRDGARVASPKAAERADRMSEDIARDVADGGRAFLSLLEPLRPSPDTLASLAPGDAPTQAALALIEHNFASAVSDSRAPTLVVWGSRDPIAPLRTAQLLKSRLRDSSLVVLPDVGHEPMSEAPTATLAAVLAHLDGTEPTARRAPSALPPAPHDPASLQSAHCENQRDFELTGSYDEVVLDHCSHARLHDVTARRLVVRNSSVSGVSVRLDNGLFAEHSQVTLTGGSIAGTMPIDASSSVFDLAGVVISADQPVVVRRRSTFLMSACTLRTTHGVRYLHGESSLKRGRTL